MLEPGEASDDNLSPPSICQLSSKRCKLSFSVHVHEMLDALHLSESVCTVQNCNTYSATEGIASSSLHGKSASMNDSTGEHDG